MRKANRLGCLSGMGLTTAVVTLLVIAGYVYAKGGLLYNPGPLNAQTGEMLGGVTSHAGTGGDCKACHTAFWESDTMADRCVKCHTTIALQMQGPSSLHGSLMSGNPDLSCHDCHSEHRGADAGLTHMETGSFPHEAVGFSLRGHQLSAKREPFTCEDCHVSDITSFALDTCRTCHSQMDSTFVIAHSIEYGDTCLNCHDGVDRFGKNFRHNFTFTLVGKHEGLICSKCHTSARSFADFQTAPMDCQACHGRDDPHQGAFGTDCSACHKPEAWTPANFDHNLAAFKLEDSHAQVKCAECHVNNVYKGTPSECFSCHKQEDRHNGAFGTDCSACHRPTDWDDVTFDHSKSNFPLTGLHLSLACEQCHSTGQFAGLSTQCAACHGDPVFHAGMFSPDCATCHTTLNWLAQYNGPHPSFGEHGGINHEGATCRDCHTQSLRAATCTKCHESNNPGDGEGGEGGGGDN